MKEGGRDGGGGRLNEGWPKCYETDRVYRLTAKPNVRRRPSLHGIALQIISQQYGNIRHGQVERKNVSTFRRDRSLSINMVEILDIFSSHARRKMDFARVDGCSVFHTAGEIERKNVNSVYSLYIACSQGMIITAKNLKMRSIINIYK